MSVQASKDLYIDLCSPASSSGNDVIHNTPETMKTGDPLMMGPIPPKRRTPAVPIFARNKPGRPTNAVIRKFCQQPRSLVSISLCLEKQKISKQIGSKNNELDVSEAKALLSQKTVRPAERKRTNVYVKSRTRRKNVVDKASSFKKNIQREFDNGKSPESSSNKIKTEMLFLSDANNDIANKEVLLFEPLRNIKNEKDIVPASTTNNCKIKNDPPISIKIKDESLISKDSWSDIQNVTSEPFKNVKNELEDSWSDGKDDDAFEPDISSDSDSDSLEVESKTQLVEVKEVLKIERDEFEENADENKCAFETDSINKLTNHKKSKHTSKKEYHCDKCKYKAYSAHDMKKHIPKHNKKFACPHSGCNYVGRFAMYLEYHKRKVHSDGEPLKCDFQGCNYMTELPLALKNHQIKRHSGAKSILCSLCPYSCYLRTELKKHMITHSTATPFACDYPGCNYACKIRSNLTKHKRMHTEEKPYACDQCAFRSNFISSLKAHKRTHTDERPYCCEQCGYRCNSASNLKKHVLLRHPGTTYELLIAPKQAKPRRKKDKQEDKSVKESRSDFPQTDGRDSVSSDVEMFIGNDESKKSAIFGNIKLE